MVKFIKEKANINTPYHKIREIIKNKFNIIYKRLNQRQRNYSIRTLFAARRLFSVKFTNTIDENHLGVNIDECSIWRICRANYSLRIKDSNIECQNINSVGSINLVLAWCSNRCWFLMITADTIKIEWKINIYSCSNMYPYIPARVHAIRFYHKFLIHVSPTTKLCLLL